MNASAASPNDRVVLLAGASGLVGREILRGLLAGDSVAAVPSLGRRELPLQHAKLTQHRVNFVVRTAAQVLNGGLVRKCRTARRHNVRRTSEFQNEQHAQEKAPQ